MLHPEAKDGNLFYRDWTLAKGERIDGHSHNFQHTTFVFRGAIFVTAREFYGETYAHARVAREKVCLLREQTMREVEAWEHIGRAYVATDALYQERLTHYQDLATAAMEDWAGASREAFKQAEIFCLQNGMTRISHAKQFTAGARVPIHPYVFHDIEGMHAVNDISCVYGHRDAQGRITQAWDGWAEAYD